MEEVMSYKLQVVDENLSVSFNSKRDNLSNYSSPEILATASNGKVVKETSTYNGQVLGKGATQRQWCDEDGNFYAKADLTFTYEGEVVQENSMTKVFNVTSYEPASNYTDRYIIDKWHKNYRKYIIMGTIYSKTIKRR